METRANYVVIGAFTLAVIVGVFGFIYWFQNLGGASERIRYRVVFEGSVSGLRTGGTVLFNGIRIGEVTAVTLNPQKPKEVVANIAVDSGVVIRKDTEVGMEFQGLTGIAALSFKGGNPDSEVIPASKDNPSTIYAPPGATQDVTAAAREVLRKVDDFVASNQAAFKSALQNLDTFTGALARNSGKIDNIASGLEGLTGGPDGKGGEVNETARSLNEAAKSIKQLADNLDKRTAEISTSVTRLTNSGAREIQSLSSEAQRTLSGIDRAVQNLDRNPSRLLWGGSGSSLPEYNGRR